MPDLAWPVFYFPFSACEKGRLARVDSIISEQCVLCDCKVAAAVVVNGGVVARTLTARLLAFRFLVVSGNLHIVSYVLSTVLAAFKHGVCYSSFVLFFCLSVRQVSMLRYVANCVIKLSSLSYYSRSLTPNATVKS